MTKSTWLSVIIAMEDDFSEEDDIELLIAAEPDPAPQKSKFSRLKKANAKSRPAPALSAEAPSKKPHLDEAVDTGFSSDGEGQQDQPQQSTDKLSAEGSPVSSSKAAEHLNNDPKGSPTPGDESGGDVGEENDDAGSEEDAASVGDPWDEEDELEEYIEKRRKSTQDDPGDYGHTAAGRSPHQDWNNIPCRSLGRMS